MNDGAALPQIDQPIAGFYRLKLVKDGPWCAVRLWYGQPPDPEDRTQLLDRSLRWQCEIDGYEADPWIIWPLVAGRQIPEEEYRYLLAVAKHARDWEPGYPEARPDKPIDLLNVKTPF